MNSGSCQKRNKSPDFQYHHSSSKKPVTASNKSNKHHHNTREHYIKKISAIINPFETGNIEEEEDDAVRFICESGILGSPVEIMGNAISGIFRKHSKVNATFQEPVNKEQVKSNIFISHSVHSYVQVNAVKSHREIITFSAFYFHLRCHDKFRY